LADYDASAVFKLDDATSEIAAARRFAEEVSSHLDANGWDIT
jgi:hypothetical protein